MNKPYVIAEMGVNFYDTAKSWEFHHLLPQNFILIRQQKLVLIVQIPII